MSKVLVKIDDSNWYDQLASISNYYEIDIEERILNHAGDTFKGYIVLPFKILISDKSGGSSRPDLVLIREDYSMWYVAEVELFKHGRQHPEKQIDVFIDGIYNPDVIVPYLIEKKGDLDESRLRHLIKSEHPPVLVIVDGPNASWIDDFRKKALVCIFEVYKNTAGTELFRLNGDYPHIITGETHLKQNPAFVYEVIDPQFLPHEDEEGIEVFFMGKKMLGKVKFIKEKKFLLIKNSLIPPKKDLVLFTDNNDNYIIRLN